MGCEGRLVLILLRYWYFSVSAVKVESDEHCGFLKGIHEIIHPGKRVGVGNIHVLRRRQSTKNCFEPSSLGTKRRGEAYFGWLGSIKPALRISATSLAVICRLARP